MEYCVQQWGGKTVQPLGKQQRGRALREKAELLWDPAIPLLGAYLKELKTGSLEGICVFSHSGIYHIAKM